MQEDLEGDKTFVAFHGTDVIGRGPLSELVAAAKQLHDAQSKKKRRQRIAFFDDATGRAIDIALEGRKAKVLSRLADHPALEGQGGAPPTTSRGPGRPKLGVVSREVTLLPRHWQWLAQQRGGASAALRRLVEAARKSTASQDLVRQSVEAAHRFAWDIAGDQPGFEEATRALFAQDFKAFDRHIASWPAGLREQLERLLRPARTQ